MPRTLDAIDSLTPENQEQLPQEATPPAAPPDPAWNEPPRKRTRRFSLRAVLAIGASFLAGLLFFGGIFYLRLARMTDRLLAEGAFSTSLDIFSAPETIGVGDTFTAESLAATLQHTGYTRTTNSSGDRYEMRGRELEIVPKPESGADPVRVQFAQGKISSIASLRDRGARRTYTLEPRLLTNLSANRQKRRLVHFGQIPSSLVNAVTSVEDKRFFDHWGFDPRRMVKAAYVDFRDNSKQQGASTLTMQLARAFFLDPTKSWRRKFSEFLITLHLEHKLSKQQIFEDYVNEVYFGRRGTYNIHGAGEAARVYFAKDLHEITVPEAALLAGMIQRPSYYNPFRYPARALARRNLVLALMRRNARLSDAQYATAVASPLQLAPPVSGETENSYFLALLNDELQTSDSAAPVHTVVSTLDPELQSAAEAAVRSGMLAVDKLLRGKKGAGAEPDQPQVALIALDPRTGEIKALVGGRDYSRSQLNHAVAMRQPGSVFKPFVYAAAIDAGLHGGPFTPATVLSDEATTFSYSGMTYQPKNFHNSYQGPVTLRAALAHSLNVATVSLAQQVGLQKVVDLARSAGLNDKIRATPALALGAYEATPLEIAAAYTVFANQGVLVTPTTIREVRAADGTVTSRHTPQTRLALDPRVAYITTNLLQEVLRSGTGAGVRGRGFVLPAAGKTGTSHDGWFAGFTTELLCVVWVGFDDNRELNLEGAKSALPIWAEFMKRASASRPYNDAKNFARPAGVSTADICDLSGQLPGPYCRRTHSEVFLSGTEPNVECDGHDEQELPGALPFDTGKL
ncbi:MAG: PBP1A family penicillin-binding protein [Candidatus Solibacter sp.]